MAITVNEGDIVDFNLVTDTILGPKRVGVVISAPPMDYSIAIRLDPEINSKHKNLFPFFSNKVNNVDNPASYKYFAVRNANGVAEIIGVPWVLDSTYKAILVRQKTYVIHNFQEFMRAPIETYMANLGCTFSSLEDTDVK